MNYRDLTGLVSKPTDEGQETEGFGSPVASILPSSARSLRDAHCQSVSLGRGVEQNLLSPQVCTLTVSLNSSPFSALLVPPRGQTNLDEEKSPDTKSTD